MLRRLGETLVTAVRAPEKDAAEARAASQSAKQQSELAVALSNLLGLDAAEREAAKDAGRRGSTCMPNFLLVPVRLDALVLQNAHPVAAAITEFGRLPFVGDDGDQHAETPCLNEALLSRPPTIVTRKTEASS